MSAIYGIINLNYKPCIYGDLLKMENAISYRGRDIASYFLTNKNNISNFTNQQLNDSNLICQDPHLLIGSLSSSQKQAAYNSQNTTVFCSGNIYNFQELFLDLKSRGASFNGQSYAELLSWTYQIYGLDLFERLNGSWAIAIFDHRVNKLILSRDRFGEEPLYWLKNEDTVYFASEIKALLQIYKNAEPNLSAINQWLTSNSKNVLEQTFFKEVIPFAPATYAEIDKSFPNTKKCFWKLPSKRLTSAEISIDQASSKLKELLVDSVKLRSESNMCFELSSGLDSSILAYIGSQLCQSPITAYCTNFIGLENNENHEASIFAKSIGAKFVSVDSPPELLWPNISSFTSLMEEPYESPSFQAYQILLSKIKSDNFDVSFCGEASDEIFAGEENYYYAAEISNVFHGRILSYIGNAFGRRDKKGLIRSLISPVWQSLKKISQPKEQYDFSILLKQKFLYTALPNRLFLFDRLAMSIPIQRRMPYLDRRIVDFAFMLPEDYLVRNGYLKWILRKAFEKDLPANLLWQKNKHVVAWHYEDFVKRNMIFISKLSEVANQENINIGENLPSWNKLSYLLWNEFFIKKNITLFKELEQMARP